ncbi:hypothetical protein [Dactylosporangium sp. NPDC050588]|uniref:NACHT domain-containing protein n=1 Tax=Dactylosporangium sp. NPDC050588 TaxID=3157211 RepID=UPI0033E18C3B
MARYNLNGLGSTEFESLAQALIKKVIGNGTITFGAGRDGAREAKFSGRAPYPSRAEQWRGEWIFQAKFHDTELLGVDKARQALLADIPRELEKITTKFKHPCDNYVMITNVPLTSVPETGTHALGSLAFNKNRRYVKKFALWGADDIARMLDQYPEIRTAYLQFLTPGDLIAQLLGDRIKRSDEIAKTMQSYIRTAFTREQDAQLDQAGDVTDDPVRLQQVFFDLSAVPVEDLSRFANLKLNRIVRIASGGTPRKYPVVRLMLSEAVSQVAIIGGPGEGKSTVGQYLAQLHRATLLKKVDEVALDGEYFPSVPRIPFRVLLKDYGQWLAQQIEIDPTSGPLDEFICETIKALSARSITPNEFHDVLRKNPILLILDGLDEVTDVTHRKVVLGRIKEFTDRCLMDYDADIQILGTSRPTAYVEQFDPEAYAHFQLSKLESSQVLSYIKRWVKAKKFDDSKAERVLEGMKDCVTDPQISAMTTTPLQATILAVIIALGGTPPQQREALFNEYLEVIYKRETAKGRNIMQSDKDRLIGLHKFIGYTLHERATHANEMAAYLDKKSYTKLVRSFIRFKNPYLPEDIYAAEIKAITHDAGDRLVLIVEPVEDRYGFELRSIQEFFAACHLVDTSKTTSQRFERFGVICTLAHWRNVALFFAGRVGRNFEGEIYNIVEVCRSVDRSGPDRHLRRGAHLALELAVDRPFPGDANGQRSLLEHGLTFLESDLTLGRQREACMLLRNLHADDLRDHVNPLLAARIKSLSPELLENFAAAAESVGNLVLARRATERMAGSSQSTLGVLRLVATHGLAILAPGISYGVLLSTHSTADIAAALCSGSLTNVVEFIVEVDKSGEISRDNCTAILRELFSRHPYIVEGEDGTRLATAPGPLEWGERTHLWPIFAMSLICRIRADYTSARRRTSRMNPNSTAIDLLAQESNLPAQILAGDFEDLVLAGEPLLAAPLWISHLWLGNVTSESIARFVHWYASYTEFRQPGSLLGRFAQSFLNPGLDFLISRLEARPDFKLSAEELNVLLKYSGCAGSKHWNTVLAKVRETVLVPPRSVRGMQTGAEERAAVYLEARALNEYNFEPSVAEYIEDAVLGQIVSIDPATLLKETLSTMVITNPRLATFSLVTDARSSKAKHYGNKLSLIRYCLESNRVDSGGVLARTIPGALQAGALTEEEVLGSLSLIGQQYDQLVPQPTHDSACLDATELQYLIKLLLSPADSMVKRGCAVLMVRCGGAYLTATVLSRPRFAGFSDQHRALASHVDEECRRAAFSTFAIRLPSSGVDLELIGSLLASDGSPSNLLMLRRIVNLSRERMLRPWSNFFTAQLERDLPSPTRAVFVDVLDGLLAEAEQSIGAIEEDLGLPLQYDSGMLSPRSV